MNGAERSSLIYTLTAIHPSEGETHAQAQNRSGDQARWQLQLVDTHLKTSDDDGRDGKIDRKRPPDQPDQEPHNHVTQDSCDL
jgi:hypothetical protein